MCGVPLWMCHMSFRVVCCGFVFQGFVTFVLFFLPLNLYQNRPHTNTKTKTGFLCHYYYFLHFTTIIVTYCWLVCYFLLSFLYFDKGLFYSPTLWCSAPLVTSH